MTEETKNKWKICRICLQADSRKLYSLVQEHPEKVKEFKYLTNILDEIEFFGGIKINTNFDGMPDKICDSCLTLLRAAYKFRQLCQKSNDQLYKLKHLEEPLIIVQQSNEVASKDVFCTPGNKIREEFKEGLITLLEITRESFDTVELENEAGEHMNSTDGQSSGQQLNLETDYLSDTTIVNDIKEETIFEIKRPVSKCKKNRRKKLQKPQRSVEQKTSPSTSAVETTHICPTCGNTYNGRSKLTMHMKIHAKERPHECEICGKRFAMTPQLARHMNSHTGNRPFKCQFCSASFADPSTKIKHERIHTNERPYKCKICGKSFSYSNVLKVHLTIHTGEKPYSCSVCDKSFAQLHHKNSHEKRHKKINTATKTTFYELIRSSVQES